MNYDTMTAHELVLEIAKDATAEVVNLMNANISYEVRRAEIEPFLMKAVVREASVGTKEIYDPHTGKFYVADLIPNPEKSPFA